MITIKELDFGYKKTNLFESLNLEIQPGRIFGLFGKNGEGKTSLIRLLSGLLFPRNGSIDIDGMSPMERKPMFLQDLFFLEENPIMPNIKIEEFAKYYGVFYPKFSIQDYWKYIDIFGIYNETKKIHELSFGTQKKVLISFALAANTKILFMDEPTNGLDIPSKKQFRDIIFMRDTTNKYTLISTHQVRDLHSLIDSVIFMQNNKIILNKTIEQIQEKLLFSLIDPSEMSERTLYYEQVLKTNLAIEANTHKMESEVNIELLFNAISQTPESICKILNS